MTGRTERLMMDDVEEMGYYSLRAPASGARQNHEAGDIWIVRSDSFDTSMGTPFRYTDLYIVEEKYKAGNSRKSIQVKRDKLKRMVEMANDIEATPLVAVRWSTRLDYWSDSEHYMMDPLPFTIQETETPSIHPDDAKKNGVPMSEYFDNETPMMF